MAKKKSVEELYKSIFSIRDKLQEALQLAADVSNQAQAFGGEISRVLTEQFNKFFIPEITKFVDDANTPGAMLPLVSFLDSVPLAMTRGEPTPQEIAPMPINATAEANIAAPPTAPAGGSYAAQVQVQERLGRNACGWEKHPSEVDADIDDYEYEWERHPDELSYEDDDFEDDPHPYAMDTVMDEKKTRESVEGEYWLVNYWTASKVKKAIAVKLDFADFEEAEEEVESLIPEPYTKMVVRGRVPKWSLDREGINVIESCAKLSSKKRVKEYYAVAQSCAGQTSLEGGGLKESSIKEGFLGDIRRKTGESKKFMKEGFPIGEEVESDFEEEVPSRESLTQEFLSMEDAISNIPGKYEMQVADDNFKTMIDSYIDQYNDSFPEIPAESDNVETWSDELLESIVASGKEMVDQVIPLKEAESERLDLDKAKGESYGIYRKNTGGSSLGDQSNMEDFLVATRNTKEEADALVKELEATILPSEKEFLGIEYFVKPLKIEAKKEPEGKPAKKDASLKEANLNFSDGVTLNTGGKLRVVKKYDGYYVVGDGMSVPVSDREEGYELINELNNPSEKPWKGHEGGELPYVGKNDATAHAVWNKNIGKYEPRVKVAFLAKNPDIGLVRKEIKIPVGKSGIGDKFTRVYEFQWETNEIPYLDPFYMFRSSFLEAQSEYKQYFRPYGRTRVGEIVIWQD